MTAVNSWVQLSYVFCPKPNYTIVSLVGIVLTHALYREKYTEKVYIIDDIFTKVQQKMS